MPVPIATPTGPVQVEVGEVECKGCRAAVAKLVGELPGVEIGFVDYADRSLQLRIAPPTDLATVRELLEAKGFPVSAPISVTE